MKIVDGVISFSVGVVGIASYWLISFDAFHPSEKTVAATAFLAMGCVAMSRLTGLLK